MFACVVRFFKLQVFKLQMFKTPTVREERSKGALKVADTAGEAGPVSTREMMGVRGLHPEGVWPKSGARKGPSLKKLEKGLGGGLVPKERAVGSDGGKGSPHIEQIQFSQYFVVCSPVLFSVFVCLFLTIKLFIYFVFLYLLFVALFVCYNEVVF